ATKTATVQAIIDNYKSIAKLDARANVRLEFDDEALDPRSRVGDTEIEDDDMITAYWNLVIKHKPEGVRGISESLAMLEHMKRFGTVTSFKLMRDPLTRESTGMAHITYMRYDDAQTVLRNRVQSVRGLIVPFDTIYISPYHPHAE
ncbi:hypothetical protein GGI22_007947, partial [Coemansia erecta]